MQSTNSVLLPNKAGIVHIWAMRCKEISLKKRKNSIKQIKISEWPKN